MTKTTQERWLAGYYQHLVGSRIINVAVIDDGAGNLLERAAVSIANGERVYLPSVQRP